MVHLNVGDTMIFSDSIIQLHEIHTVYIHHFIFIFPGYIMTQFNDQLPVSLLAVVPSPKWPRPSEARKLGVYSMCTQRALITADMTDRFDAIYS